MLKTWTHIFGPQKLSWRWTFVNFVKLPGYRYESTKVFRHRDFAGRVKEGPMEDRYLHHEDGKLRKLIVACSDELFEGDDNTTWRRTYIRMVSPLRVRIATWVIDFSYDPKSWDDWWIMLLRAFPAAFATSVLVSQGWEGKMDWKDRCKKRVCSISQHLLTREINSSGTASPTAGNSRAATHLYHTGSTGTPRCGVTTWRTE